MSSTTPPTLPSDPAPASLIQSEIRTCSICRRRLEPLYFYKRCSPCLEKAREYKRSAAAKRDALLNIAIPNETSATSKDVKRKRKRDNDLSGGSKLLKRMKEGLENEGKISVGAALLPIPVSVFVVVIISYHTTAPYRRPLSIPVTSSIKQPVGCMRLSSAFALLRSTNSTAAFRS